jgi:hypothetical protein
VSTTPDIASTAPLAAPAATVSVSEDASVIVTPAAAPQSLPLALNKGNCRYSRTTEALTQ